MAVRPDEVESCIKRPAAFDARPLHLTPNVPAPRRGTGAFHLISRLVATASPQGEAFVRVSAASFVKRLTALPSPGGEGGREAG